MRTVIGLLPARAGRIWLKGEDITGESADRRARRGIGYVPQGREIFPHMSVRDNLRMGRFVKAHGGSFALDEVLAGSPSCASEYAGVAARSPAASRRCWRSPGRS